MTYIPDRTSLKLLLKDWESDSAVHCPQEYRQNQAVQQMWADIAMGRTVP